MSITGGSIIIIERLRRSNARAAAANQFQVDGAAESSRVPHCRGGSADDQFGCKDLGLGRLASAQS